ncbi:MAG: bifunctional aspartate transaminase/aspartate 4-decarboxylase, partial [Psychromonas sp.]
MNRTAQKRLETLSPFEVKNTLIALADKNYDKATINAGRGNPNWVATTPREAFFKLGEFSLLEANRKFKNYPGFGGVAEKAGIEARFNEYFLNNQSEGTALLNDALNYCHNDLNIAKADLLLEWTDGILGDNYPVPDRMLKASEKIVEQYILQEMGAKNTSVSGKFDVFAVEGGTAAMVYIFNTLKSNGFLNAGDTIAIGAPVFTPYIEIPELEDYQLNKIEIHADENNGWQMTGEELDKLKDPTVKAFFLVNPSNPASVKLDIETLQKIADIVKQRPDLILLTDDVYGTFADDFTSLAMIAPQNTILVYSFSKYFGATGWRLGAIATHEDNIFDDMLSNLP